LSEITLTKKLKSFGGFIEYYEHDSSANHSKMAFSVFLPPQIEQGPVPVLYWLSGLTCTEENFMSKAGAQRVAAELGIMLVAPDTSPRNLGIEGEDDSYDFGSGAGFYINATEKKWATHYNMYDYVTKELPEIVNKNFKVDANKKSVFGHSMGGHGALIAALRNPGEYKSVSAFAPIVAPMECPWGQRAFTGYLGKDTKEWAKYDATRLIATAKEKLPLFVDQGTSDEFLKEQLLTEKLEEACKKADHPLTLRFQEGYDHSYYFIATFIEDHLRHHAKYLC